jgi:hypothetical protein
MAVRVGFEPKTLLTGFQVIEDSLLHVPSLPRLPTRITQNCPNRLTPSGRAAGASFSSGWCGRAISWPAARST